MAEGWPPQTLTCTAAAGRSAAAWLAAMALPLVRMTPGADYVAWLAPAVALSGAGTKLLLWRREGQKTRWTELADLAKYGLRRISRLALRPDRRWLAIVAETAPSAR